MTRDQAAIGRTFLVGCPRSGTTLLQSLLFTHEDVVSFPETWFWVNVYPARLPYRRTLRLSKPRAQAALENLDAIGVAPDPSPPPFRSFTVRGYARRFIRRMDRSARDAGASVWLEKTPHHARHIALIERQIPRARFVHIIRAGEAVVASLRDAAADDPVTWPESRAAALATVWQRYLHYSLPYVGHENHAFVSYERLVESPETVLTGLCGFLGLRCDEPTLDRMLEGYRTSSERLIGRVVRSGETVSVAGEPWKTGTGGAIANRNELKFTRLFTESERAEVTAAVASEREALASIPFL